ncbi:MAG: tetratricopeptide repeat protein, partial [Melioribacteraceae bacterium]|nr:tetratricopeptide repeat protein [Melioribacteraceae bacterium]
NPIKISLTVNRIIDEYESTSIYNQTVEILINDLLVDVNKITKNIAKAIENNINSLEKVEQLSLLIYPFEENTDIADEIEIGNYFADYFLYDLEYVPYLTRVEKYIPQKQITQNPNEFELLLKGSFKIYGDRFTYTANLVHSKSQNVYTFSYSSLQKNFEDYLYEGSLKLSLFLENYLELKDEMIFDYSVSEFINMGEKYLSESNLSKAQIFFEKAVEKDPNNTEALMKLGNTQKRNQNYTGAESTFRQVLKINPNNAEAYLYLGEVYFDRLEDSLALYNFNKAAELADLQNDNETKASAYTGLGNLKSSNGSYNEAIKYFEKAMKSSTENISILYGIGNAYYLKYTESEDKLADTSDIVTSIGYFNEGAELFPEDSTFMRDVAYLLSYWGKQYYEHKQRDKAFSKFEQASLIDHYDIDLKAECYNYMSYFKYLDYNDIEAKQYSEQSVALKPSDEWSYRIYSFLYKKDSTKSDIALRYAEKANSISESAFNYQTIGDIYITKKDYDKAFKSFQKAKEMELFASSNTLEGLYNSSKLSKDPAKYDFTIKYFKEELNKYGDDDFESNQLKVKIVRWLIEIKREVPTSVGQQIVFDDLLPYVKSKDDSVWVLNERAAYSRSLNKDEEALEYTRQSLKLMDDNYYAYVLLDSLYLRDSDTSAIDLKIETLKNKVQRENLFADILSLGNSLILVKDFEKASEYFNSALKKSTNNSDSSQVYKYKGDLHRQEGVSRLTQADSTEAGESFRLSIDNYLKAYDSDSTKLIALSYISFIYHEYLYNFEKAFKYAKILYDKNPKNLIYAINFAEISMTSGEIDSSFNIAKSYLTQDLEKKIKLPNNYKMTLKFLIVCTEILRKKYLNAYKEFGSLQKNYIKYDSWQTIGWTWNGTRHFLNSQLEGDYKNILLKTLDALSLPKNEGLIELNEIDVKWTKLLE